MSRPADKADRVSCYPRSYQKLSLGACIDRFATDPQNLQQEGARRTDCTRCPWGRERRAAWANDRPVIDPHGHRAHSLGPMERSSS